jgi:hypothetical protein
MRRQFSWTGKQLDKLNKVQEVLNELQDYKPLTLRQVYYQLVGKGYIENKSSQYGMLSNLLKWARIDGHINWNDIEDRVRAFKDLRGFDNREDFMRQELEGFLNGYRRDLLQTQDKYMEIWIEKDALSSIFVRVAREYTIPVVVCRGFSSVSFLNEFCDRLRFYNDKKPVMLYFGDLDPSGMEMLTAMEITLRQELNAPWIEFKRIALLEEDISTYKLPHNPKALKRTDTRANKHLAAYGELAVELDALRPDVLEQKIRSAIESELDIDAFNQEVEKNNSEFELLDRLKNDVEVFMDSYL